MSNIYIKEISKLIFESINKRDFLTFESIINEDIIFDFPGVDQMKGVKKVILFFNILFRKYTSLHFDIVEIIAEENKTCVKWNNKGEEKDGTFYSNSGLTWFHFQNNKVSFMSDDFKDTSFNN